MIPVIDLHCDTLTQANFHFQHDLYRLPLEELDVERLLEGGVKAQFFAICLPKITTVNKLGRLYEGDWKHIRRLAGILHHTCELHFDSISQYGRPGQGQRAEYGGTGEGRRAHYGRPGEPQGKARVSAILTVEDGRDICGDLRRLDLYRRLGVKLITLTWNYENCFGYPNSTDPDAMEKGLKDFGREAVEEMNRLGILIDVSHLSDGGFRDVAAISRKPFAATHSNCRALCEHPRNLTDEMIRRIGECGGVIGLNQYPPFLRRNSREARMEDMAAHLRHMTDIGGTGCAALGSDYDGMRRGMHLSVRGPQEYQKFAQYLMEHGFSRDETEKIFYKNAQRVLTTA